MVCNDFARSSSLWSHSKGGENCNLPVGLACWKREIASFLNGLLGVILLFSSPSDSILMQMMFYMCFCYGLETWMMKRAWRDQGSNLEKFSYLHSDLTGNDVLLVTFFDGSHPQTL